MGKSELVKQMVESIAQKNNTIDLDAYAKGCEDMFDHFNKQIQSFNDSQDAILNLPEKESRDYSHSPTESDVLVEGDWFIGTEEEYRKVSSIWKYSGLKLTIIDGCCIVGKNGSFYGVNNYYPDIPEKKTQLTAPEFIRRAENTFKTKQDERIHGNM